MICGWLADTCCFSNHIPYFSGIFGVFLSLSYMRLMELDLDKAEISKIAGLSKVCMKPNGLLKYMK